MIMLHKDEYLNATEAYPTFGFEKALEDARDIACEQYTDDPDDPHWQEDPYEGFCLRRDDEQCEDEPLSLYEKYPLDSSFYQAAM